LNPRARADTHLRFLKKIRIRRHKLSNVVGDHVRPYSDQASVELLVRSVIVLSGALASNSYVAVSRRLQDLFASKLLGKDIVNQRVDSVKNAVFFDQTRGDLYVLDVRGIEDVVLIENIHEASSIYVCVESASSIVHDMSGSSCKSF